MDKFTRKELKTDKFAREVGHTVEYLGEHRRQVILWGGIGFAVLLIAVGTYWYTNRQHSLRQAELREALRIQEAAVGPGSSEFIRTFATQADKDKAILQAFNDIIAKHPRSDEAAISRYYLGVMSSDQGNLEDAEKYWKEVSDTANKDYASLAKFSLAELYAGQGKRDEAEKLLRSLVDKPTILVSKEQATIALARVIAPAKPDEARKLLEPLRTERSTVSRAALAALSELPSQ